VAFVIELSRNDVYETKEDNDENRHVWLDHAENCNSDLSMWLI